MSRPRTVATRPGLSLTAMLALSDDTMQFQRVSPRSARSEVSWLQSRSQGPARGRKWRGLVVLRRVDGVAGVTSGNGRP
jgi:hypothetical protein